MAAGNDRFRQMIRKVATAAQPAARSVKSGRGEVRELDRRLAAILRELAFLLISSGYGTARFNVAIRRAYVEAASSLQTKGGRPITNARIAALTGLTRTEVARLQKSRGRTDLERKGQVDRANRVTNGWARDPEFLDAYERPKVLPFAGKHKSFSSLVKKYSGDIPARAMLAEMERLKLIRRQGVDEIELLKPEATASRHTLQALRALGLWSGSLAKLSSESSGDIESNASTINLRFSSLPQAHSAFRELQNRRQAFEQTIKELSAEKTASSKFELRVAIAMASALPKNRRSISPRKGRNR